MFVTEKFRLIWRKKSKGIAFGFEVCNITLVGKSEMLIIAEISFSNVCTSLFRDEIGFVHSTKWLILPSL